MLSRDEFNVLIYAMDNEKFSQRELASNLKIAIGKANKLLLVLTERKLLDEYKITELGLRELKPYKVKNAIILAAGFASRCAPLSYEKPKGLFKVRGEILIERQIKQLKERGINEIYVVVGYMKELFFYLEKKFDVHIVINPDYYRKNNLSSVWHAKNVFGNSYICYSDNYITENGYTPYVYDSYFAAQYSEDYIDEYVTEFNKHGLIQQYYIGGAKCWYQMGEMYFSQKTAKEFINLLEKEYDYPIVADMKVDDFYIRHLASLDFYVKKYPSNTVVEFDTVAEIERFDDKFVQNMGDNILSNICKTLHCTDADIKNVKQIKRGNTNIIFSFEVNGKKYVYRHPGRGSEKIINRQKEYSAMLLANDLDLDPTLLACDPIKGWKISNYVENIDFDYANCNDEQRAIEVIRKLHAYPGKNKLGWELDMLKGADALQALVPISFYNAYQEFGQIREQISTLFYNTKLDGYKTEMCHNDCCDSNILLGRYDTYIIDWEYAGDNDPAADIASFIIGCQHSREDVERILNSYLQHEMTQEERRHYYAYIAISAYYYFSWGIYEESTGKDIGDLTLIWYNYIAEYAPLALSMY